MRSRRARSTLAPLVITMLLLAALLSVGSASILGAESPTPEPGASGSPPPFLEPGASESPSTPPTFDVVPRRRPLDELRRFVGPATLKLSGRAGSHRWRSIAFGTHDVELRVSLAGSGDPCLVNVRLVDEGQPIVDEWFSSASAAREVQVVTVPVDYATARLKVDSDCRAWSARLRPVTDEGLPSTIEEVTYTVRGRSIDELVSATQRIEGRWAAYTEWFIGWVYLTERIADGCRASQGETWLRSTITFPEWRVPDAVDPALTGVWERYADSLWTHEVGHVTIALQGADAIDERLDEGFEAPTCAQAKRQAEAAANAILEQTNRRSARYDQSSGHGATQGVILE